MMVLLGKIALPSEFVFTNKNKFQENSFSMGTPGGGVVVLTALNVLECFQLSHLTQIVLELIT